MEAGGGGMGRWGLGPESARSCSPVRACPVPGSGEGSRTKTQGPGEGSRGAVRSVSPS